MRSRLWLARENLESRGIGGPAGSVLARMAARMNRSTAASQALDILVHCAQEMNHLAQVLPAAYSNFKAS